MNNKELFLFLNKNEKILNNISLSFEKDKENLIIDNKELLKKIIKNINLKDEMYLGVICEFLTSINKRKTKENIAKAINKISEVIKNLSKKDLSKIGNGIDVYTSDISIKVLKIVKDIIYKNLYVYNFDEEVYVEIKKSPNLEIYLSKNKRLINKKSFNKLYSRKAIEKIKEESCCLIIVWLIKMKNKFESKGINIEDTISNIGDINEIDELSYKCIEIILCSKNLLGVRFLKLLLEHKNIQLGD